LSNSKRKCCYCKEYFPPDTGKIINQSFFCSMDHAIYYANERAAKIQKSKAEAKERKKQHDAENFKKMKANLKPKGGWEAAPQKAVNKFIRIRDTGKTCISCDREMKFGVAMQFARGAIAVAGHFRSVGSAKNMRFNTKNINAQCVQCNSWKSGNRAGYEAGIIKRFGQQRLDDLIADQSTKNYTRDDFKRITRIFNRRAKHYKTLPPDSSRFLCKFTPEQQESLPL